MHEILHYRRTNGVIVFQDWLDGLKDARTQARIAVQLDRMQQGNLGDSKPVGHGVYELRVDFGPGYRIYYARIGRQIILLLSGGSKRRQDQDIAAAIKYLIDYKKRSIRP